MTWAFRNGSFRGVPFYVDRVTRSSGRSLVAHDVPQGAGEVWEDTGPESDVIAFDAYAVAPHAERSRLAIPNASGGSTAITKSSFYDWRDALLAALEQQGPGTLVHPSHGTIWARARRYSISEDQGEVWFIRFALEFVRDRELEATPDESTRSGAGEAQERTDELEAASGARVERDLVTTSTAERARRSTETELLAISRRLRELDRFTARGQQAANLARQAVRIAQDAKALAVAPANMVSTIVTAVRDVQRAISDLPGAFAAYESLLQLVPTIYNSPIEDRNSRMVNGLFRGAALAGALRAAVDLPWTSYEQAVAARNRLIARIDELAPHASDAEFEALMSTQSSIVGLIPPENEQLPRVGSYTPPETSPAIAIAWRLYGDVDREAEIIARNRVRNPNFIPGGRALEVLVDGAR